MFDYLSTKEKRAELRFPVVLPLSYLELGASDSLDAHTQDISQGGLCLATDKEIPIGAQIEIILKMIDSEEMIQKRGTVVWSARYGDDKCRVGIKLQDTKLKPVPLVLRTIMALTQAHSQKKPA